ncbi:hypothetical protein RD792_001432 [Penstemon davidsonii]|uniref:Uncharacterized protein n=1 Tax=Penstemon davidsonii TaxID=160366 RepID=A0ABR0DNE8_9LAMI|nr:hypothetical protein RD792_001432 [Penstemon davidsonii]
MGRPPCCDKVGVKKGPWTPEEDIMLVSYVQEHGPGNWRAIPKTTGLKRCSKSCRLRWTNYLRPGIKRGSFTDQEEKMIIQLQALLGNKWAAIASYLPERTDNDIKNYWNTHLKKKLKKLESGSGTDQSTTSHGLSHSISRGQWERRLQDNITTAKQALHDALSFENTYKQLVQPSYASSTENIAKLLKQWVKKPIKSEETSKCSSTQNSSSDQEIVPKRETDLNEAFESLFGFESFESSINSDDFSRSTSPVLVNGESELSDPNVLAPLSVLENWLLDDQGKDYLTNFSFDENPDLFL